MQTGPSSFAPCPSVDASGQQSTPADLSHLPNIFHHDHDWPLNYSLHAPNARHHPFTKPLFAPSAPYPKFEDFLVRPANPIIPDVPQVSTEETAAAATALASLPLAPPAAVKRKRTAGESTAGQRSSVYRGVTRHRWTGRFEAHLWDNSCKREGQTRKGRQVYLGGYDNEEKAARAYDLAALKYWGTSSTTNFPISDYSKEMEEMKLVSKHEFIVSIRRRSTGFSRGASAYRGVTRHNQQGRWQARIGRVSGNKDLYLGTFGTEEEAAEAYDVAALKFRGANAVTNFELSRYDLGAIAAAITLPIGPASKRLKLLQVDQPKQFVKMPTDLHQAQCIDQPLLGSGSIDVVHQLFQNDPRNASYSLNTVFDEQGETWSDNFSSFS